MSGTTVKSAAEETSSSKTKKRGSRKQPAKKTAARKTATKKKTASKQTVSKKAAVKKTAARKISIKPPGTQPQKSEPAPKQAGTAGDDRPAEDTRSLSWMSAQAASALKAVKASQAEKGQAVLARTRKQTDKHLDDDSLIRIAAEMPVDNDALEAFLTEQPLEEQSQQPDAASSAMPPVIDTTGNMTERSGDSEAMFESITDLKDGESEVTTTSTAHVKPTLPTAPQKSAKRSVVFLRALAASLLFVALLLGYYFWPGGDTGSPVMAIQESTESEPSASVIDLVDPQQTTTADVATTPLAEPEQESAGINRSWTPAAVPGTWQESDPPQTTAVAPAVEAETAPLEPSPNDSTDAPQPVQLTQPVQPAQSAQPAQSVQPAQQAVPAQPDRRAPAQGYYPQQRRPAYPQYYYR